MRRRADIFLGFPKGPRPRRYPQHRLDCTWARVKKQPGPGIGLPDAKREGRSPPESPFHRQRTSAVTHIGEKRTYGIIDFQHRSDIELHVFGVRQKGLVTGSDVADL